MPLPASVAVLFLLLMLALLAGARFLTHLVTEGRIRNLRVAKGTRDVLIVGAGEGGRLVVRELMRNPELRMRPVGFIDDDPRKRRLEGRVRAARARHHPPGGPRARARRGRAR